MGKKVSIAPLRCYGDAAQRRGRARGLVRTLLKKASELALVCNYKVIVLASPMEKTAAAAAAEETSPTNKHSFAHFPYRFESTRNLAFHTFSSTTAASAPAAAAAAVDTDALYESMDADEAAATALEEAANESSKTTPWLRGEHALWLASKPGLKEIARVLSGDMVAPTNTATVRDMLENGELAMKPEKVATKRVLKLMQERAYEPLAEGVLNGSFVAGSVDLKAFKARIAQEDSDRIEQQRILEQLVPADVRPQLVAPRTRPSERKSTTTTTTTTTTTPKPRYTVKKASRAKAVAAIVAAETTVAPKQKKAKRQRTTKQQGSGEEWSDDDDDDETDDETKPAATTTTNSSADVDLTAAAASLPLKKRKARAE